MADEVLRRRLAELDRLFADVLDEKLAEIESLRRTLEVDWSRAALERVCAISHRLAGSAATFGHPSVTDAALALESRLRSWEAADSPAPDWRAELWAGIEALHEARRADRADRPGSDDDTS